MTRPTSNTERSQTGQLAVRMEVLPGASVVERFEVARQAGFDAVELPGRFLADYREDLLANSARLPLPVSSISLGFRHSLLSRDAEHRRICREDIAGLLRLCRKVSARGLVMPPLLSRDCSEGYYPASQGAASRDDMLIEQLLGLSAIAQTEQAEIWLEPVNHAETDYMITLDHAARVSRRVNHPSVGIVADFFHMMIDEPAFAAAITDCADQLSHVHVSNEHRQEPRRNTPHLAEFLATLSRIKYHGTIAVEARELSGEVFSSLKDCAVDMRQLIAGDRYRPA